MRRYVYIKQLKQPDFEIIEQIDTDIWLCVSTRPLTGYDVIAEIKGDTITVIDPQKFKPHYERRIA